MEAIRPLASGAGMRAPQAVRLDGESGCSWWREEKLAAEVGSIREVLCEGYSKTTETRLTGRTPQNKILVYEGPHDRLRGELLPVRVLETKGLTLCVELARDPRKLTHRNLRKSHLHPPKAAVPGTA